MNKKKIQEIAIEDAEESGKWLKAYLVDDILVLDCYESRKYIGRYCMQTSGKYDFCLPAEKKWMIKKLSAVYKNPWYWEVDINCTEKSRKLIEEFVGEQQFPRKVGNLIDVKESEYNRKKSEKAYMRKRDRINNLMDEVPVLPEGFYTWLNQTIFGNKEYMFRTDKGTWKCTACGKEHRPKQPYKDKQEVMCSRTKKMVTVKSRNNPVKKRENVMIFQRMDDLRSVARHFVAERVWSSQESSTEAYENVRYIMGKNYTEEIRLTSLTERKLNIPDVVWYYGQWSDSDEFEQDWWDSNPKNKRCNEEYCYPVGINEALSGTAYHNSRINLHLDLFANLGWKIQYNKMMINKEICGFMEYMAKAGLKRMTEEASSCLSAWGGFYDGEKLNIAGKNASEVLGIDMQRFYRLRQQDGGYRYLEWMRWEQEQGKKIPEETVKWMHENRIDCGDIKFILNRMTPVQVKNYLEKQSKLTKKSPHSLITYWKDYLSMAERLEMDVSDEIVYRAKELLLRHDELVEVINEMNEDEQADRIKKKFPEAESILKEIKERYEYQNDQYSLIVPSRVQEIMRDGRQLHHCAASSELYFERISQRETYIMFLRKNTRPLYAWYTLEVEPGGTVRQKRSEYNRQPEIEEVKKFLAEWQQVLKKRMKQEDLELAEKSRKNRIMEMEELKERNERFAGVLEADLMEVV